MTAELLSVNSGQARPIQLGRETVSTGIFKLPITGRVRIGKLGVSGDEQLDRRYHGGPDKAVNLYPSEHYAYWAKLLKTELGPGAFGENLTTVGLTEESIAIGDVLRIGEALLQITQPRQPCGKLAARHEEPKLVKMVYETGKTGFYLRCLEAGSVAANDTIEIEDRDPVGISVLEALRIMDDRTNRAGAERLMQVAALSEAWREELSQRPV